MRGVRKCFARGLARAVPRTVAIDDVDLHISAADIVAVMGDEGAGKTTLLQCACGLLRPDRGNIEWRGETVSTPVRQEAGIVYVPAVPIYYPFLTPHDVLAFRLSRCSVRPRLESLSIDEVLVLTYLHDVADSSIVRLDGPRLRCLAIAEALILSPALVVIDTSIGESVSSDLLARIAERGTAILIGMRDAGSIVSVATRLVYLQHGRIDRTFVMEPRIMFVAERFH